MLRVTHHNSPEYFLSPVTAVTLGEDSCATPGALPPVPATAECCQGVLCVATESTAGFKWLTERPRLETVPCTHKNPPVWRLGSTKGFGRSERGDVWVGVTRRATARLLSLLLRKGEIFLFDLRKQSYLCPFGQDKGLWKVPGVPKVGNGSGYALLVHTLPILLPNILGREDSPHLQPSPPHSAQSSHEIPTAESCQGLSQQPQPQGRAAGNISISGSAHPERSPSRSCHSWGAIPKPAPKRTVSKP